MTWNSKDPDVRLVTSCENIFAYELVQLLAEIKLKIDTLEQIVSAANSVPKVLYFCDDEFMIGDWHELEPEPLLTTLGSHSITPLANTYLTFDKYATDPIGVTSIPAGDWVFHLWLNIASAAGTNYGQIKLFKISEAGVATAIHSGYTIQTADIADLGWIREEIRITLPAENNLLATDRIGVEVGFLTSVSKIVQFSHDIALGRVSSMSSPLNA
jgi:hypothetical protein